jgi:hypothetical protein
LAARVLDYDEDSEDKAALLLLDILELYQIVGKYESNRDSCINAALTVGVHLYRLYQIWLFQA